MRERALVCRSRRSAQLLQRVATTMRFLTAFAMLVCSVHANAHGDDAVARASITLWLQLAIVVAALAYGRGLVGVWRAAGPGRGLKRAAAASFAAGLAVLALLLTERVERYATESFAAHMAQHEILMLVAAPLLVLGRPLACWTWAMPLRARARVARAFEAPAWRVVWRALTSPLGATAVQVVALIAWHVPGAFDAAATNPWMHALQHASFLVGALAFSWAIVARPARGNLGERIAALFLTMIATGALGALLTFAGRPWYAAYRTGAEALADQQLGGLLMWIPGGAVYLIAALWLLRGWLGQPPRIALR